MKPQALPGRLSYLLAALLLLSLASCSGSGGATRSSPASSGGTQAPVVSPTAEDAAVIAVINAQVAASYLELTPKNPSFGTPHLFIINPEGRIVQDYGHGAHDEQDFILEGPGLLNILGTLIDPKK